MKKLLIICFLLLPVRSIVAQDSLAIHKVGRVYNCWSNMYQMETHNGFLMVNAGSAGFQVLDISNPPECEALYRPERSIGDPFVIDGERAYFNMSDSIGIYDIANLPELSLASYYTTGRTNEFTVSDGILYYRSFVVENRRPVNILRVVDLNDPEHPRDLGFTRQIAAQELVVRGNLLYCANTGQDHFGRIRFTIFDVTNPDSIRKLDESDPIGTVRDLQVHGDLAYVACDDTTFMMFDVSDPENIRELARIDNIGYIYQIEVIDNWVFAGGRNLTAIDVGDPANPVVVDMVPENGNDIWVRLALNEDVLLTASYNYPRLKFFDVSDPSDSRLIGERETRIRLSGVITKDDFIYTRFGDGVIGILDASDPVNPVELSIFRLTEGMSTSVGMKLNGTHLFCSYWESDPDPDIRGLRVVDVANPREPQIVWSDSLGSISDMSIRGDRLYLAKGTAGLQIWDASDPADMALLGSFDLPGFTKNIIVSGDYVYLSQITTNADSLRENIEELITLDVTSPENPTEIGRDRIFYGARTEMAFNSDNLYLLGEDSLRIYSLADPADPVRVRGIRLNQTFNDMKFIGEDYLALGGFTLRLLSLKDEFGRPRTPVEIGYYNNPGHCSELAVRDNLLYVADEYSLGIYDISEATGWTSVDQTGSLPGNFAVISAYPNPFNGQVSIRYSIEKPGFVSVVLLDITGRQLADLDHGYRVIGSYRVNTELSRLPSGRYFAGIGQGELNRIIPITCVK